MTRNARRGRWVAMARHPRAVDARGPARLALAGALLGVACGVAPATAATVGPLPQEGGPGLPNGRAYELVSPVEKNGVDIGIPQRFDATGIHAVNDGAPGFMATPDGDSVLFAATGGFADAHSIGTYGFSQYRATRTADGWGTSPQTPPATETPATTVGTGEIVGATRDLDRTFLYSPQPLAPGTPLGQNNMFLRNAGGATLLSPTLGIGAQMFGGLFAPASFLPNLRGASEDLAVGVFQSTDALFPGANVFATNLYAWGPNGPRLLAADADAGMPATSATSPSGLSGRAGRRAVSADGRTIAYMGSLSTGGQVFVEVNGGPSVQASLPQGGPTPPNSRVASFQQMSKNGGTVLFTTTAALTSNGFAYPAPTSNVNVGDLYAYDVVAGTLSNLTPATGSGPAGARVDQVVAMADDASTLYFTALGVINGQGVNGQSSLFVRRNGQTSYVMRLEGNPRFETYQATADGRFLVFASAAAAPGGYDNTSKPMVYRYDAVEDELACLSCRPDGTPSGNGAAPALPSVGSLSLSAISGQRPRTMSDDGRRVFFNSADALVRGASNGRENVYLWEDGALSLVSTGRGAGNALLFGTSSSGDDVFFTTRERLVGADVDNNLDLYTARVGGGFPEATPPSPPCTGDACQGGQSSPVHRPVPGSHVDGPGNVVPPVEPAKPTFRLAPLKASAARQLAAGKPARVPVRITGGGTLKLRATARVGGRQRTVGQATRTVRQTRPVTANLSLRLSSVARRELAKGRQIRVRIRVTSSRVSGAQVRTVRIAPAAKMGRGI